jgi:hypothetical protein
MLQALARWLDDARHAGVNVLGNIVQARPGRIPRIPAENRNAFYFSCTGRAWTMRGDLCRHLGVEGSLREVVDAEVLSAQSRKNRDIESRRQFLGL